MIDFTTKRKPVADLPLTAMIDVVFILLFFFMLTTNFMRIESMELMLPGKQKAAPAKQEISRIIMHNDGRLQFGQRDMPMQELEGTLQTIFKERPNQAVVVFVDDAVSMQHMVTVLDTVNISGGQSIYVRALKKPAAQRGGGS